MSISESALSRQVKGIIGELVAREYLRENGYVVWLLSVVSPGNLLRNPYYFTTYGGSGKEHFHIDRVLTPAEAMFLSRTRIFDLLAVHKTQLTLEKAEMTRLLIDVKTSFGGGTHRWTPKRIHKTRYIADLKTARAFRFEVKTLNLNLTFKFEVSLSNIPGPED